MSIAFEIQQIFFEKLKEALPDTRIFKILTKEESGKFILIESIQEDKTSFLRLEFNVVLDVRSGCFNYSQFYEMVSKIKEAINESNFKHIKGFVNVNQSGLFISSSAVAGVLGKIEFTLFFTPIWSI